MSSLVYFNEIVTSHLADRWCSGVLTWYQCLQAILTYLTFSLLIPLKKYLSPVRQSNPALHERHQQERVQVSLPVLGCSGKQPGEMECCCDLGGNNHAVSAWALQVRDTANDHQDADGLHILKYFFLFVCLFLWKPSGKSLILGTPYWHLLRLKTLVCMNTGHYWVYCSFWFSLPPLSSLSCLHISLFPVVVCCK